MKYTNVQINNELILKAVELGKHNSKESAITEALSIYIRNLEQKKIISLFNTIDYDPKYNFKKQRART